MKFLAVQTVGTRNYRARDFALRGARGLSVRTRGAPPRTYVRRAQIREVSPLEHTFAPAPLPRPPSGRVQLTLRPMHSNIPSNLTPRAPFVPCIVSIEHVF